MKNIETILAEAGLTLTEEQKTAIAKAVGENYKPVNDWQKQVDKVKDLETTLNDTKAQLEKFDGVDVEGKDKLIKELQESITAKENEYQQKIADMEFDDLVKESIASAKGKNAKAIKALLDVDALKASKNQKEDIATALKTLAEAEDSKMLFGETGTVLGNGNPIGSVTKNNGGDTPTAEMRAIMGLPPLTK